jgi:hypothetical protein
MKKDAEIFARVDQEFVDKIDAEAAKIGETRSTMVRIMLREALAARGHFAETMDGAKAEIRRRAKVRKAG